MRVRMAGASTLLSSNVKASTMCWRSMSVWLTKNWRAWL